MILFVKLIQVWGTAERAKKLISWRSGTNGRWRSERWGSKTHPAGLRDVIAFQTKLLRNVQKCLDLRKPLLPFSWFSKIQQFLCVCVNLSTCRAKTVQFQSLPSPLTLKKARILYGNFSNYSKKYHLSPRGVFVYVYIYNGVFCPHIDQLIHPWYLWKGSLSSPNVNSMFICQKDTKSGAEEVLQQNRIPLKELLNAVYVSAVSLAVGLHWVTRHFPLSSINWCLNFLETCVTFAIKDIFI